MQYQTVHNIILFSFLLTLVQTASVLKREDPEEKCKPVVMCPQFCLKVRGKCYVCECEGSMNNYMEGGMNTLHQTYQQPVYQTGNQFQNSGVSGFGGAAMGLSSAPSASGGSGQPDTSYNSWMSHFGLSGSGNEPIQQQTTGGMTYQHYLEPNFQEFYRPVFGAIPGRCIGVDYRCPTKCWRTNTYSGCIECACQASPSTTPASPTTTETEATNESIPTTAKSTTTMEAPHTTPSNSSFEKSNNTNSTLTTEESGNTTKKESNEQTTIKPLTTTERSLLNTESLATMSGADLILMLMDGMKRNQSLQQMLQQITMQKTQETTTQTTTTTTKTTQRTTPTTTTTSTEPTTTITTETAHKSLHIDNCPEIDTSCPLKCLIFDSISRCTLCSCMDKLLPRENSSHECEDIDASCPSDCIAIDDYLCPVCNCLSTTASPIVTSTTPYTQALTTATETPTREVVKFSQELVCNVQQSITECSRECLRLDNNFCPICSCDKPTTKSTVSDYFCRPIPVTCPIKCIAVDVDYCPVCRC